MGSPYNSDYVSAARETAKAEVQAAAERGKWDWMVSQEQSKAVIAQAEADKFSRLKEAEVQLKINTDALQVRKLEAGNEFKARMREAQVDELRAMAAQTAANAQVVKSESHMVRSQAQADRARSREDRLRDRDLGRYGVSPFDFQSIGTA